MCSLCNKKKDKEHDEQLELKNHNYYEPIDESKSPTSQNSSSLPRMWSREPSRTKLWATSIKKIKLQVNINFKSIEYT